VNRWLKLAISGVAVAVLAVTGVIHPPGVQSPASANTDTAPTIIHGAKGSSLWVGADSAGTLFWSNNSGSTWTSSGFGLTKSGVSSVVWTGNQFLATSYFEGARSSDGKTWTRFLLPLGSAFDPGNLISDAEFFKPASMTAEAIQAFLVDKNPTCQAGAVCMKDYRETTFSRDATVLCKAYQGAENETAAQIVAKVSEACGVSAEALLVLIQKEQSLITLTAPSTTRFQKATGYACPDTAPCDERYFGFYNQVYNAARQFKRYSNPPGTSRFFTWFPVNQTSQVRLHPNAACGTTPVTIRNQATAGLYYYTPYTPNQIAVTNLASTGDSCSAYGNRNFWRIYNYWFNPTKDFRTFATTRNGQTVVVDRDGTVAVSSGLSSWQRLAPVPGASGANRVAEFGQTNQGNFAVLLANGKAYQSGDATNWSEMNVQITQANQTTVIRHTVKSGDTVWAIARSNRVTVASVVSENSLPRDGALIRVGQVLTITKTEVVNNVSSPVLADPSIVISAGAVQPAVPDVPAEQTPSDGVPVAPVEGSETPDSTDTPADAGTVTPEPVLPPLEALVTESSATDVFYTVARGDTLLRIAFRNQTTVRKLVADNGIRNVNRIFVGQRLKVGQTTTVRTFHRAQEGDTPERIASRRSVNVSGVLSLNPTLAAGVVITPGTLVRLS
jgi:LysM repeat protein